LEAVRLTLPVAVLVTVKGTTTEFEALQTLTGCPLAVTLTSGWVATVMGTLFETVAWQLADGGVPADVTVSEMVKGDVEGHTVFGSLVHLTLKMVPLAGLDETAKSGQEHTQCWSRWHEV
jgi:hypothetical protein